MPTVHAAGWLVPLGGEPVPGGAVAVDGGRIVSLGRYEDVLARHPGALVRRWPGVIAPGLVNRDGPALLEAAYHPDPREAAELGEAPLTGAALAALEMTPARWGHSARRGLQRMLRCGVTAVSGPFLHPAVATAVTRSGLRVVERPRLPGAPERAPDLDPLSGEPFASAAYGPLEPGGRADLAVFDAPGPDAIGPGGCLATVLAGRLVFRRA